MKTLNRTISFAVSLLLVGTAARSNAAEELTKEQRIAEFAKMPVAERQKPEFFAMKLVAKDSAQRVAAESDRSKIKLAENEEILVDAQVNDGKPFPELLIVEKKSQINRTHISDMNAHFGENGWEVSIKFTDVGTKLFGNLTTAATGQRFAMVVGGSVVLSSPNINEPILGGSAVISASYFTEKDVTLITSLFAEPKPAEPK